MRPVLYLIIHCAATREGIPYTVADVDRWHRQRGWSGVGYHYVIELDGKVRPGRPESEAGAHCKGYNHRSIGICYIGGLSATGQPKDTRTPAQQEALTRLVKELLNQYPHALVAGHNQFAPKACPSFSVPQWAAEVGIPPQRIWTGVLH